MEAGNKNTERHDIAKRIYSPTDKKGKGWNYMWIYLHRMPTLDYCNFADLQKAFESLQFSVGWAWYNYKAQKQYSSGKAWKEAHKLALRKRRNFLKAWQANKQQR